MNKRLQKIMALALAFGLGVRVEDILKGGN